MSNHYYTINGEPRHFVEKKSGGQRNATIADARKNGWLPSPTTILRVLDKPALTEWHKRNAILAALTTPRIDGETDDAFAERVLRVDVNAISDAAKDLGTRVHDAIEKALSGEPVADSGDVMGCVMPVIDACKAFGRVIWTEKVVVGKGYAGRCDAALEGEHCITIVDFKTTGAKELPKRSYPEHRYQLASYAKALGFTGEKPIITANVYISTARIGETSVCINTEWQEDFATFELCRKLWCAINGYVPEDFPLHDNKTSAQ